MTITELIAELERIRAAEGDLVVTVYSLREWTPAHEVYVHPVRRPWLGSDGLKHEHPEKVVEIGPGDD